MSVRHNGAKQINVHQLFFYRCHYYQPGHAQPLLLVESRDGKLYFGKQAQERCLLGEYNYRHIAYIRTLWRHTAAYNIFTPYLLLIFIVLIFTCVRAVRLSSTVCEFALSFILFSKTVSLILNCNCSWFLYCN